MPNAIADSSGSCVAAGRAERRASVKPEHRLRSCSVQAERAVRSMIHFFPRQNFSFSHNPFSIHFFSMKMAELGENVLVSCIIDFDDMTIFNFA